MYKSKVRQYRRVLWNTVALNIDDMAALKNTKKKTAANIRSLVIPLPWRKASPYKVRPQSRRPSNYIFMPLSTPK